MTTGSWLAQVAIGPPWFWALVVAAWVGICAAAALAVVRRLGPRTRVALVLPSMAGILAVFVASGWLRLGLSVVSGLLLSIAVAAGAAALQALVVRAVVRPRPRHVAPVAVGREVHDPREVAGRRR